MAFLDFQNYTVKSNQIGLTNASSSGPQGTTANLNAGPYDSGDSGRYSILQSTDTNGTVSFKQFTADGQLINSSTLIQTPYQSSNAILFSQSYTGGTDYIILSNQRIINGTPSGRFTLARDQSLGSYDTSTGTFNPCFVTGTLIATTTGSVRVEALAIGDRVITASGQAREIVWIGRRHLELTRHPRVQDVRPVRILANAFGDGLPRRDLFLSPDHAVCVSVLDEVLIPVKHLVNDATIAYVDRASVTYWHVELESHDILLSEGLPTESFLDTGVRAGFENASEHQVLHPDFTPLTLEGFCRPLVQDGPIVDAVRTRLIARAKTLGWTLTDENDLHALVDGVVIRPDYDEATARFAIPAGAKEVRLVSRSFVPERVRVGAGDGRCLGTPVRGIAVIDGLGVTHSLPIDSEAFTEGFSFVQMTGETPWRWTTGKAVVPSSLWMGLEDETALVVSTAPEFGQLQAWMAPQEKATPLFALAG